MAKVSIVIVSMNNLSNLDICLPSIEKYTSTPHKIYVVAYLFSEENLKILRKKYPYIEIIESNEIRGFSENNNLALKKVDTDFTFVLNDDTEFREPVLDKLLTALKNTKEATIMSPVLQRGDGSIQFHGRRKYTFFSFMKGQLGFRKHGSSKYEYQKGIYKTYNISGAAFLIPTAVFSKLGFFDERYFFCPEDIALSTLLNEKGYNCYVDSDTTIIHYEGVSSKKSKLFYATTIVADLGESYFYGDNICKRICILCLWIYKIIALSMLNILSPTQHRKDYLYIYKQTFNAYFHSKMTKEVFINEYNKVNL